MTCGGPTPLTGLVNIAAAERRERTGYCDRHTGCKGHTAAYWRHEPYCDSCRAKMATARREATDRKNRSRQYQRDSYIKTREAGLCKDCREPVPDVNPRTGKLYIRCRDCSAKKLTRERALAQERREAGLCQRCGDPVTDINRRTGKRYTNCTICRMNALAQQRDRKYRKQRAQQVVESGIFAADTKTTKTRKRRRIPGGSPGRCQQCRAAVEDVNPRTGNPYTRCRDCRAEDRMYARRRRAVARS